MSFLYNEDGELRIPDALGMVASVALGVATKGKSIGWSEDIINAEIDIASGAMTNSSDGEFTARDGYQLTGSVAGGYLGTVAGAALVGETLLAASGPPGWVALGLVAV